MSYVVGAIAGVSGIAVICIVLFGLVIWWAEKNLPS